MRRVSPSAVSGPLQGSDEVLVTRRLLKARLACGSAPPLTRARGGCHTLLFQGGAMWLLATRPPARTGALAPC